MQGDDQKTYQYVCIEFKARDGKADVACGDKAVKATRIHAPSGTDGTFLDAVSVATDEDRAVAHARVRMTSYDQTDPKAYMVVAKVKHVMRQKVVESSNHVSEQGLGVVGPSLKRVRYLVTLVDGGTEREIPVTTLGFGAGPNGDKAYEWMHTPDLREPVLIAETKPEAQRLAREVQANHPDFSAVISKIEEQVITSKKKKLSLEPVA